MTYYKKLLYIGYIGEFTMFNNLPQGIAEFEAFANEIIAKAGLPDNDSTKWAVAAALMHYPQPNFKDYASPTDYLVDVLKRAATNQVAGQMFTDIKAKQEDAKAKAMAEAIEHDKKQNEATQLKASDDQSNQG